MWEGIPKTSQDFINVAVLSKHILNTVTFSINFKNILEDYIYITNQ